MHRTGEYGDPIYGTNSKGKQGNLVGYTPHTRRCLSEAEMAEKEMRKLDDGRWTTGQTFNFVKGGDEAEEEIGQPEGEEGNQ
jgi:hypothetical protein